MGIRHQVKTFLRYPILKRTLRSNQTKLCIGLERSLLKTGWISLGVTGDPDIKDDGATLEKIPDHSCAVILASHVLEHLDYSGPASQRVQKTIEVFKRWGQKLSKGGTCIVCVPDLDQVTHYLHEHKEDYWNLDSTLDKDVIAPLFGNMDSLYNVHRMGYNFTCIKHCMETAGFSNVKRVTDNGLLLPDYNPSTLHWISLNVQGVWHPT